MEATTQYFGKRFFYKLVLEFHRPSKFLCQTSGHQNHLSLLNIVKEKGGKSDRKPNPLLNVQEIHTET
jgi:hypothetical protein